MRELPHLFEKNRRWAAERERQSPDLNCLAVLQYAVEVLRVAHVIVCGHYGCGGVRAALEGARLGLIDNWLRHVQDVRVRHHDIVMAGNDREQRLNRLCELNVIEQAVRVCETTVVQGAWSRGQPLSIHGWIYALADGHLRDLNFCVVGPEGVEVVRREALAMLGRATAQR